jgi:hypothetical protein
MQILDPGVIATFFVFDMRTTYGKMPLEILMDEEFRPLGMASIAGSMSSVKHYAVNQAYVFEQLGKGMAQLQTRLSRSTDEDNIADIIIISVQFLASVAVSLCAYTSGRRLTSSPVRYSRYGWLQNPPRTSQEDGRTSWRS